MIRVSDHEDKRLQEGGWAPGRYTNTCFSCKIRFLGDKRAIFCAPCAYGDKDSIQEFNELVGEEQDSLERLRFFCSLAFSSKDWLNSEELFIDLKNQMENTK